MIVLIPDHCLSIYLLSLNVPEINIYLRKKVLHGPCFSCSLGSGL